MRVQPRDRVVREGDGALDRRRRGAQCRWRGLPRGTREACCGRTATHRSALQRSGARGSPSVRLEQLSEFPRGRRARRLIRGRSRRGGGDGRVANGESLSRSELAERSRALEVEELGIAGGFQDHYAAAYGGALALTFRAKTSARGDSAERPTGACARESVPHRVHGRVAHLGRDDHGGARRLSRSRAARGRGARTHEAHARRADDRRTRARERGGARRAWSASTGSISARCTRRSRRPPSTGFSTPRAHTARSAGKALGASGGGSVLIIAPAARVEEVRAHVSPLARLLPFVVDRKGAHVTVREQVETTAWRS